MNYSFETKAWAKSFVNDHAAITRLIPVTVSYKLDGNKPIGLWVYDEAGNDRTLDMTEAEYDLLYEKACKKAVEDMVCAAEDYCEVER